MIVLVAIVAAGALGLGASVLVTRASNRSALWNVAVGGGVVAVLAALLFLAVAAVERIAFR